VQASTPLTALGPRVRQTAGGRLTPGLKGSPVSTRALRALGALGLLGVLTSIFLLTAGAASRPSQYVPARSGGWPNWLAGPLEGLHVGITASRFQTLTLIMAASYLAVLLAARTVSGRALWVTIVAAHLVLLLGPPLISQDVFGYLDFARLGALHGMDPYTHVAAQVPTDSAYLFVGWPFQNSPYGPLFTLGSYAIAPLGLAGGLWALKAIAVASSIGAVALITRAARKQGHCTRFTAAFVGLNPVLLELAVGGAHNDTLLLLALATALVLTAGANPRFRGGAAALVAGVGIKVTAGLALPFLLLAPSSTRERLRVAAGAGLSLALLAALGLIGFGSHALGFLSAISEQQQLVATHSVPAEAARLVGLHGTPSWWRHCFLAGFVVVLIYALWRTLRGADWRVSAGWATLALLLSTAWLLPWYAIWVLPLAAVSGDRRLRAATLVFCAYALMIHLPLANGLLSPQHVTCHTRKDCTPGGGFRLGGHRIHLTGLQVPGHVTLDLHR
jgi:alpha-1,6-mannosyltransferase